MGAAPAVLRAWQRAAAGDRRPLRRRAQGFLRHRDVRVGDAARPRLGAVQQDHGRAVRHPDGRQPACPRPPPADAGVLVAAHRTAPGEHHPDRRWHARPHRGEWPQVRCHEGPRRAPRGRRAARRHDQHGRAAQGGVRRLPRRACPAPPTSSRARPGRRSLRQAFDRAMEEIKVIIEERRVAPRSDFISDLVNARDAGRQAQRPRVVRPDFRHLRRARCRPPAAPPAARSGCSTPTTTSAGS